MLAGIATVGYGGALGPEGPSIYLGAATGSTLQRRFARFFSREDAKLLMVAGAAAGMAAIFKAPATGALFAIEVPYRSDVARRNVLPAMVGAAASYVAYAAVEGTAPLLPIGGDPSFGWQDLLGALARRRGLRWRRPPVRRRRCAGLRADVACARCRPASASPAPAPLLAAAGLAGRRRRRHARSRSGPGYDVIVWAADPSHGASGSSCRCWPCGSRRCWPPSAGAASAAWSCPLVVMGALVGRLASGAFGKADSDLLLVVGMAAFLGAGYRTPLAAVVFVAETTAVPGFVVPALLATAASQLVIGDESVSAHQRAGRLGHLERRFELPISAVLETDVRTVPPDATIEEFLTVHLVGYRQRAVAVVEDGNRYLGPGRAGRGRGHPPGGVGDDRDPHDRPGHASPRAGPPGWCATPCSAMERRGHRRPAGGRRRRPLRRRGHHRGRPAPRRDPRAHRRAG